jgi:hypothetical protein
MTEPTKGLRLAFTPGMLGLHFRIGNEPDSYPNDMEKGERDMAYINSLIEADERQRGTLTITHDVTTVSPNFRVTARVLPAICGKPMPDGNGAGQCINVPGHEGECDDMPL